LIKKQLVCPTPLANKEAQSGRDDPRSNPPARASRAGQERSAGGADQSRSRKPHNGEATLADAVAMALAMSDSNEL